MSVFALSGLLLGITCLLLTAVLAVYGKSKLHHIWVLFNLCVSIWGFGCFVVGMSTSESIALFGWRFAHVGGLFVSVFFYHMVTVFCDLERKKTIVTSYAVGTIALCLNLMSNQFICKTRYVYGLHYNDSTPLFTVILGLWFLLVSWGFIELLKYFPKTKGIKRTQTKYLIFGFLTGFLGGTSTFLPEFNVDLLYPFGNFTIPIYCLISTYAILRHRLMDIHFVLRKSMIYSLAAGILTSLFVVLVLTMTKFLSNVAGISSFAITTVSALIIAVLFNPLKNRLQLIIDKRFYKKTYEYYPTIRKISRELTSIFDLDELFQYVGSEIHSTMGLKNINLLYAFSSSGYERVYHKLHENDRHEQNEEKSAENLNLLKNDSETVKFFKDNEEILIKDELPGFEKKLGQEIIGRIDGELAPFSGEAVVPVIKDKKLVMILILGEKLSSDMFTGEDINLLNIVSNQLAIAISNADLYKSKVHTERLASIGMMSATFAHEIRNPLTSLKTFAQLMPEKYNDEEFRETFSKIVVGEIERIDGLIGDLLDFSSDKKTSRVNFFDFTSLIDDIVEYVRGKIDFEKKGIIFRKNYSKDEINMSGDAEKLKQAFINIISNGCQAMNGGGILQVDIQPNSKHVDIAVSDTGSGIHPDDIAKIFDPFVTTKEMGIGLGLAISKRVIEDHKGQIDVESSLTKGTTFTVTLPVQNE